MIGFPYNYNDNLTTDEARENRKLFLKKYGSTILINSLFFVFIKQANADDLIPKTSKNINETPKTPNPPVFAPIVPPTTVIKSKMWTAGGVVSLAWICLTAAATGEPTLVMACTSILAYAIGKN